MASSSPRVVAVPAKGANGSARGHVWVLAATASYRCEGLDPWLEHPIYARGHADIAIGESYLRKLWQVDDGARRYFMSKSRHCIWCGRAIEMERGIG